jgi:UDP-glucuronate decarboxylase
MLELAQAIVKLCDSSSTMQFLPVPSDDPVRRRPDIRMASDVLQWEPRIALRQGLEKTIAYFSNLPRTSPQQ